MTKEYEDLFKNLSPQAQEYARILVTYIMEEMSVENDEDCHDLLAALKAIALGTEITMQDTEKNEGMN